MWNWSTSLDITNVAQNEDAGVLEEGGGGSSTSPPTVQETIDDTSERQRSWLEALHRVKNCALVFSLQHHQDQEHQNDKTISICFPFSLSLKQQITGRGGGVWSKGYFPVEQQLPPYGTFFCALVILKECCTGAKSLTRRRRRGFVDSERKEEFRFLLYSRRNTTTTTTRYTTITMPYSAEVSPDRFSKKAEEIDRILSTPDIDLWRLRELALSEGGLVNGKRALS